MKIYYEYDWAGAENECRRALEINPSSADALQWYAWLLCCTERHSEMKVYVDRALELDPHNPIVKFLSAHHLYWGGYKNEALHHSDAKIS